MEFFNMRNQNLSTSTGSAGAQEALHAQALLNQTITQVSSLAEAAAKVLGLNDEDAISVGETGLIDVDGHRVSIIPVTAHEDGELSILLSVETPYLLKDSGAEGVAAVMQHTPGALASFNATINASVDGHWMLHRSVFVHPTEAQTLAQDIAACARLADFVFGNADTAQPTND
jgi:hypothetical protein